MRMKTLGILLLSFFVMMFLFNQNIFAEGQAASVSGSESPNAEPDGREGFGVSLDTEDQTEASANSSANSNQETGKENTKSDEGEDKKVASTENDKDNEGSKDAKDAKDESSATKAKKKVLSGVIDISEDTFLNIRTGPWAKIIGNLHKGNSVEILSKEGDWFKVSYEGKTAFVHSYYVDAPGFPSHQGVEPPSGLGSNQKPGDTQVIKPADSAKSDTTIAAGSGKWADPCTPMPTRVSSNYGPRNISVGSKFHHGLDFPISNGTRLNALSDGVVTSTGWSSGGGRYLNISYSNGYSSFYCHLQKVTVSQGASVKRGQAVATSDNTGEWTTGAHLHMGIKNSSGSYVDPRNVPGMKYPPLR